MPVRGELLPGAFKKKSQALLHSSLGSSAGQAAPENRFIQQRVDGTCEIVGFAETTIVIKKVKLPAVYATSSD